MKRFFILFAAVMIVIMTSSDLRAEIHVESVVAESMKDAMIERGVSEDDAERISKRYVFFGVVMINRSQYGEFGDVVLSADAQEAGALLGGALAASHGAYGDESFDETASMMLLASRGGLDRRAAVDLFSIMAASGFDHKDACATIAEAVEHVRSLAPKDRGRELCETLAESAERGEGREELSAMIVEIGVRFRKDQKLLASKINSSSNSGDGDSVDRSSNIASVNDRDDEIDSSAHAAAADVEDDQTVEDPEEQEIEQERPEDQQSADAEAPAPEDEAAKDDDEKDDESAQDEAEDAEGTANPDHAEREVSTPGVLDR